MQEVRRKALTSPNGRMAILQWVPIGDPPTRRLVQRHGAMIGAWTGYRSLLKPALDERQKRLELTNEGDYDFASPGADYVRTALRKEELVHAIAEVCGRGKV
jgi:hypothetical protein